MVQIVDMGKTASGMLAESLGQALGTFGGTVGGEKLGFERNVGRLEKAFNKADPNKTFIEQLRDIAPTLLSTQGGAQALGELAPLLAKQAESKAIRDAIDKRKQGLTSGGNAPPGMQQQNQPNQPGPQFPQSQPQDTRPPKPPGMSETDYNLRYPKQPWSPENVFPERTAGPTPLKELSPAEKEFRRLELMENSAAYGPAMSYAEASNIVEKEQQDIKDANNQIQLEKDRIDQAQKVLGADMVKRAKAEGLVKESNPEDEAVVEKLALQAKNAPSAVDAWTYVKSGVEDYQRARADIQREISDIGSDALTNAARWANGTYKSKEQTIKNIQPQIEIYKKYGLINELRNDLQDGLGWGAEDAETAMFPFEGQAKEQIDNFPKNNKKVKKLSPVPGVNYVTDIFPDERYNLSGDEYAQFKDNLRNYLSDNPSVNLVALRGNINQDKRYSWNDFATVISELIKEGKFKPDRIQSQQISIISHAPLPGLASQFGFGLTGTK